MEQKYQRHSAVRLFVGDILRAEFVESVGDLANYCVLEKKKFFRCNVIGVVVDKEQAGAITNLLLDDGSGKVVLRSFEEDKRVSSIEVGAVVLVIGKVRVYSNEKYLSAEIIKVVSKEWLLVRKKELERCAVKEVSLNYESEVVESKIEVQNGLKEESEVEKVVEESSVKEEIVEEIPVVGGDNVEVELPSAKITKIISELDSGEGVPIEEVIEKSPLKETEEIIERMLKSGEIFANKPGKVKVL
jgi:RPA family protein